MRVRLLGPVDVLVDGAPRPVHGLRRKAVLAALALRAGEIVSTDRLVDIVWGDEAPATAAATLQNHVSHLRGVLGRRTAIVAHAPGYVLNLDPEPTDVHTAERLIRDGRVSPDPRYREAQLQAAVALWRGPALTDLTDLPRFSDDAQRLGQLFLEAQHALIETRLTLGRHADVLPDLEALRREHPLDEQVHRQLITALYRAGRQGDALATYQALRRRLRDELGVDPSQPLRELEAAVLRQDAGLDAAQQPPPVVTGRVPAQVPPGVAGFTGREEKLRELDDLLPGDDGTSERTGVVIAAISGTAGVGKTSLATHWAHQVAPRFPDGQLYVDLCGFEPSGSTVSPTEAVRGFLDAFAVPVQQIPEGLDAQVGLYRSLLAGKRVLVVLDNARDVEQVRPLLPGSDGCMVIVTSRNQLTPLVATEGAHPLTLDLLTADEARDLLIHRLGADRVAREPKAVDDIIGGCARLPLALAIAAARAAIYPGFPLAGQAAELRDAAAALDPFEAGDPATDVRAVLSWSYQALRPDAARLFRLLGLHPGPDLTVHAAASLAAIEPQQARTLLADLTRAHLVSEHVRGRYTFHELLRAYAIEQADAHEDGQQRYVAVQRVLDHYLHTANAAAFCLFPKWDPIELAQPQPGVVLERLADSDDALAWFTAEYPVLVRAVERAAASGFDTHAWQLAWSVSTYLHRWGIGPDETTVQRVGLEAARRLGHRAGLGLLLRALAISYHRCGRYEEAELSFQQTLEVCIELSDYTAQAHAYTGLAGAADAFGRSALALEYAERSLDLYRIEAGDLWEANALNGVGWCHAQLGNHQEAVTYCKQALAILERLDDVDGQANTWDSLGYAYLGLGDHARAADCYQHALDLGRDLGDRFYEADTLTHLGDAHHDAGNRDAARKAWQQALDILDELGHRQAEQLRARLDRHPAGVR